MKQRKKSCLFAALALFSVIPARASEPSIRCELSAVGIVVSAETLAALEELKSTTSSSPGIKWGLLSDHARINTLSILEEIPNAPQNKVLPTQPAETLNPDVTDLLRRFSITGDELDQHVLARIRAALHTHIEFEIASGSQKSLRWLIEHIRANATLARMRHDLVAFLNSVPHKVFEEIFQYIATNRPRDLDPLTLQQLALRLTKTAIDFDLRSDLYKVGTLVVVPHELTAKETNELIPLPVMPLQLHGSYLESSKGVEHDLHLWRKLLNAYQRVAPEFPDDASGIQRYTPVQAAYQRALNKETDSRRRVVLTWTYQSLVFELNDDIARGVEGAIRNLNRLGDRTIEEEQFTSKFMTSLPKNHFAKDELEPWELFRERDVLLRELRKDTQRH